MIERVSAGQNLILPATRSTIITMTDRNPKVYVLSTIVLALTAIVALLLYWAL
jgi:hypothetical protein